jgi:hypothetical protein
MKYIITTLLLVLAFRCTAQYVTEANGRKGLKDVDGKVLLPFEYDSIIQFKQFGQNTEFYILRSGFKYGIYHKGSQLNTGCIYDRVYAQYEILFLRRKDKLGFVASDPSGSWKIIEPKYHELYPMREYTFGGADPLHAILPEGNPLSVRIDSLWGIVSYTDGHYRIPCSYRNEIITFERNTVWYSFDNALDRQIILNPTTGADFHSPTPSSVEFNADSSLLIITSQHNSSQKQDTLHSQIFIFATGERIWHHESTATTMKVNVYDSSLVAVTEFYNTPNEKRKHDLKLFTIYNLQSGSKLFTYDGNEEEAMKIDTKVDRWEVSIVGYWNNKVHLEKTIMK